MPGKSASLANKLAEQNKALTKLFVAAGHEYIEPEIVQPADVFLERTGEDLRSRTFVFTDPDGNELCLRPDLTVPTCRYHLAQAPSPSSLGRYCYDGLAFRHHASGVKTPREFLQLGLETFGADDLEQAEADIFNLTIAAMETAGLKNYTVRLGDLGLFRSLLSAIEMPDRWRRQLAHDFWRPRAFHSLLRDLTGEQPEKQTSISANVETLVNDKGLDAVSFVENLLEENDWTLVPGRSTREIAERLSEKAADKVAKPLDKAAAEQINKYLNIHGELETVQAALREAALAKSPAFASAIKKMTRRIDLIDLEAIKNGEISFAAEFGRSLEYYTGFVFQIEVTDQNGAPVVIAGGGRYDDLISDIGNCDAVPAVGCAVYAERLLDAIEGKAT